MALDTPLSQINIALEGRFDFLRKTNPFRSKEDIEAEELANRRSRDPEGSAQAAFRGLLRGAKPLPPRKVKVTDG